MRLRLRLLWLLISSLWRSRLGVLDDSVLALRVLPNDIDISRITDDRYAAIMDLGRIDMAIRTGFTKIMMKRKWAPLATFVTIRFRYPLKVFQRYTLRTRIIYWDDDSFCFRQTFERRGRTLATGYVLATLLGPSGPVSPNDILAEIPGNPDKPERPWIVSQLHDLDAMMHSEQREPARHPDEQSFAPKPFRDPA